MPDSPANADTAGPTPARLGPVTSPNTIGIELSINGEARTSQVAPWTTLLDLLRERLGLTGTKKGCDHGQCGACTVLVDGRRINSCLTLAVDEGRPRSPRSRGWPSGGRLHPLQQASSSTTPSSAATARRARSVSAVGADRGGPGAHAATRSASNERQSLPLRRLPEHRRRDRAGDAWPDGRRRRHEPLHLLRAPTTSPSAVRAVAADPRGQVHRRRHQPPRPDEGGRRAPGAAGRHHPAAAAIDRGHRRRRPADRRARDQHATLAYDDRVERRYPLLSSAILAGASPQLRNMATTGGNLLQRTRCHYFYDPATPCNKREPGTRLPAPSTASTASTPSSARASTASPPTRPTCASRWPRSTRVVRVTGPGGERAIPFAEFHRLPGDTPEHRHQARGTTS